MATDDATRNMVETHQRYFHGDGNSPGVLTRLALLEDFMGTLKRLGMIGLAAVIGLWLNLLWQIFEHYSRTKGAG